MRVIIILALVASALAVPKSITRIVGGTDTTIEEHPYMANMQFGWFGIWWSQSCGGALITANAILSAAHCYVGDPASSWRAILGTSFRSSGGITHTLSSISVHAGYSSITYENDIAIARLTTPATLSQTISTARIGGFEVVDGTTITAIGWGRTTYQGPVSEQLQQVDINAINQELCAERYAYLKTQPGFANWPDITPGMLCAGILDVGGKDACQGDSGGPVLNGDIIVGVTSWGYRCADPTYPGVLARVSYYVDWILQNTA